MSRNRLWSSSLAYTVGNLLIQGVSFITLPLYTRVMTQADYGNYNLYLSWVTIFAIFIGLQVNGSFSIAKVKFDKRFDDYVATSSLVSLLFFLILSLVAFCFRGFLESLLGFPSEIVIFILFQAFFSHLQACFSQYFIQNQETKHQLFLSFGLTFGNVFLSVALLLALKNGVWARIIGGFVPLLILGILYFLFLLKKKVVWWQKAYLPFILATSLPLVFHTLGHNLLNQLDRIMIGKMLGMRQVALYSFGYSLGLIIQIVLNSMNTAWVPWFFEAKRQKNKEQIQEYKRHYLLAGTFLTLGYLSVFPELVGLMGSSAYRDSQSFIAWIIVSYYLVFLYTFPVNIQFYHGSTLYIPVGTLLSAGINFLLNLVLIGWLGIYGAALATLLAYLLLLVFHHLIAKARYRYDEMTEKHFLVLIGLVGLYALFINQFLDQLWVRWLACFFISLAFAWYYRAIITRFLQKRNLF
ncbi:lipopolysaccharide biosynthesis protein [Streptococcus sp. DD12]|uniref:lipopolysaccharide biosynthesis protein n=1 Tax=Streptococcus sp. DD12 TaxID=1777880 RepID=UPI00079C1F84|nr:oligosaccharide flippase family protein [Streptococcus sp. DD12]KXT76176.1 polysaccharide biosynthesis protein CpsL [Streptococcus sp. DD12]